MIVLEPYSYTVSGFKDHFLTGSHNYNPWYREYWQKVEALALLILVRHLKYRKRKYKHKWT